jgi:ATP-dependent protease ClpP protease subunit
MQKQFNRRMGSEVGNGYINPFVVSAEQQVQVKYKCRLYGAYDSSEDFLYTLEVLEMAEDHDIVELHVQGPGGSLDAVITLLHAMDKCKCPVHVIATGSLASAATFPILAADSYELHQFTSFMFHSASFGVAPQKTHDVIEEAIHNWKQCERIIRDMYEGFFTTEELDSMLQGRTFWMDAEEFSSRYEARNELLADEEKAKKDPPDEHKEGTGQTVGCSGNCSDCLCE